MRVLIADDDRIFIDILTWALTRWDYQPEAVQDGDAAFQALSQPDAPRLALLDWEMPGMPGPDVVRRLRGLSRPRPTYCILLTVHTTQHEISAGLEAGAHDFLSKPMHHLQLRRRLNVWRRLIELEERHGEAGLTIE